MLNNLFVPHEIASQLIKLGFDDPCLAYYSVSEKKHVQSPQTYNFGMICGLIPKFQSEDTICLPTWEQAFDFIEYKFGFLGNVDHDSKCYFWIVSDKNYVLDDSDVARTVNGEFNSKLDAKFDCIQYMLKQIKTTINE